MNTPSYNPEMYSLQRPPQGPENLFQNKIVSNYQELLQSDPQNPNKKGKKYTEIDSLQKADGHSATLRLHVIIFSIYFCLSPGSCLITEAILFSNTTARAFSRSFKLLIIVITAVGYQTIQMRNTHAPDDRLFLLLY